MCRYGHNVSPFQMDNVALERMYPTPYANSSLLPLLLMSLAMQKHTPDTKKYIQSEYDYIVVGAGAGGSVVASRLSEVPCVSVLVLEAGKSPPLLTEVPGIARSFIGSDIDWNYKTAPQKHTGAGLTNRQLQWPSGKAVGGSSVLNAMLNVRGNRRNYDAWAKQGAIGWSYAEVLPYFKRLEEHREPFVDDPGYHGYFGPVTTEKPGYNPAFRRALFQAAVDMGQPIIDTNGRFQKGFSDFTITARDGQRMSAAKAYLVPVEDRPNLDIVAETLVTKVLIERGRAVGVEIEIEGQRYHVKARREVILSAGTVNTAQLLLLSGIGPREHLRQMQIPVVADLPVGLNFQDHCGAILPYTITQEIPLFLHKLAHPYNIRRYINTRRGPLSSSEGISMFAFLNNDRNAPITALPDQQVYFAEAVFEVAKYQTNVNPLGYQMVFGPYENMTSVWCISQILNPKSRGSVTLSSPDVHDPPVIDPNYFEVEQDVTDVVEGMKQCMEIMGQEPLQRLDVQPYESIFPGCEQFAGDEEAYFRCMARSFIFTLSHPVGTAKMGHPRDPTTVVDPELRVLGVKGLRVVDASIMPIIPSGNTYVPTMMVAEKASDMIKQNIQCYG